MALWKNWTKREMLDESNKRLADIERQQSEEVAIRQLIQGDWPCSHSRIVRKGMDPLICTFCGILMKEVQSFERGPRFEPA